MQEQTALLPQDYIFNHVFRKLASTFDKYRNIIPAIEELEQEIVAKEPGNAFQMTITVIMSLKLHTEKSRLVQEIFENVQQDFSHAFTPHEVPEHPGKYYIDSIADY